MSVKETSIDLGYAETCESWKLESRFFPSKVGGKPAWLDLFNLPNEVKCSCCSKPCIFLCQVYAPIDTLESCFHRTIFIFLCTDPECCVANESKNFSVYRCQLKRENEYYSSQPPVEEESWMPDIEPMIANLCSVCGLKGGSHCAKCKVTYYCTKDHQTIDWKAVHKEICGKVEPPSLQKKANILLPEYELAIEREELIDDDEEHTAKNKSDKERLEEFLQMVKEGRTGILAASDAAEPEHLPETVEDKQFSKFKKRIKQNPSQVLRYERGGSPLWISSAHVPSEADIPNCEYCGVQRQFEFQILPQLLNYLKIDSVGKSVDWGTLAVYTCTQNCSEGPAYKKEFLWKQDVSVEAEK